MANNVTLDPMSGGSVVKTTESGGFHHQHIVIEYDVGGTPTPVSSSAKLPVRATEIETILGEVQASPTSNTVQDRLKSIMGYLDGVEGYVDGIEALLTTMDADTSIMADWDNAAGNGASVSGDVAHDDADAGEPVKIGYKAVAHGANPTAVAAGDRTNGYASRHGIPFVIGGHPNILTKQLNVTDADGAQTDTSLVTVGAGAKIVVTMLQVMCDKDNTGAVAVRIGFGTANTPAADAAGIVTSHPGIAPGSGIVVGSGAGIIGVGADNEDLRLTCEDPAGGAVDVIVTYYTIES